MSPAGEPAQRAAADPAGTFLYETLGASPLGALESLGGRFAFALRCPVVYTVPGPGDKSPTIPLRRVAGGKYVIDDPAEARKGR
jgi:hypothetical protein